MSDNAEIIVTSGIIGYGDVKLAALSFMGDALNPDSQAVQLLRELAAIDPYNPYGKLDSNAPHGDTPEWCFYCGEFASAGHTPDCAHAKAKAFIAALDVK